MRSRILIPILMLLASLTASAQLKQIAIIDLPGRPGFDSVAFANGHLVITHAAAGTVDIFNPVRRRLVAVSLPRRFTATQLNDRIDRLGLATILVQREALDKDRAALLVEVCRGRGIRLRSNSRAAR